MPGHIRELNRLEPHSSHDLVFKIWRNNKTEATFGVFCLWLWVTRNQISMGTTGIFISRNIKFKILPSINASLSDFTGFFALKASQKIAIFVWIFTCVDFRGKNFCWPQWTRDSTRWDSFLTFFVSIVFCYRQQNRQKLMVVIFYSFVT